MAQMNHKKISSESYCRIVDLLEFLVSKGLDPETMSHVDAVYVSLHADIFAQKQALDQPLWMN